MLTNKYKLSFVKFFERILFKSPLKYMKLEETKYDEMHVIYFDETCSKILKGTLKSTNSIGNKT